MKKSALINLIVLIAIKSVSACQVAAGSNIIEENQSKISTLLVISLTFLIATIVLSHFKKGWERLIPIWISGAAFGFSWIQRNIESECGIGSVQISQVTVAVTFVCFLAQFISWWIFRKKRRAEIS